MQAAKYMLEGILREKGLYVENAAQKECILRSTCANSIATGFAGTAVPNEFEELLDLPGGQEARLELLPTILPRFAPLITDNKVANDNDIR